MGLSELSTYEYARIGANFYYINNPAYQCGSKVAVYYANKRQKNPENLEARFRKQQGCGVITNTIMCEIDGIGYKSCLCTFKTSHYSFYWTTYKSFKQGVLPYPGSLSEQPAKIMEILSLMAHLETDWQQTQAEKTKKKK